jgi:hypothetical protein
MSGRGGDGSHGLAQQFHRINATLAGHRQQLREQLAALADQCRQLVAGDIFKSLKLVLVITHHQPAAHVPILRTLAPFAALRLNVNSRYPRRRPGNLTHNHPSWHNGAVNSYYKISVIEY